MVFSEKDFQHSGNPTYVAVKLSTEVSHLLFSTMHIASDHDGAMHPGAHGMSGVPLSTAATLIAYEAVRHRPIHGCPGPTKVLH